ncbi:jg20564, partial [Pararge aegeria aegeria]
TYNSTTVPADTPAYVAIVTADKVTAIIPHIQREQWYHVRALAFTSTAEGKHSNSFNFKVNSNNENDLRMSCEKVMSETPVSAVIL